MPTIHQLLSVRGFQNYKKHLIDERRTFDIISTGYSRTFKTRHETVHLSKYQSTNSLFSCYNKIKSDIKKSEVHLDRVPQHKIQYYSIADNLRKKSEIKFPTKVKLIDIKSAYLTCLRNAGIITPFTFDFVQQKNKIRSLTERYERGEMAVEEYKDILGNIKVTRLKSVGMLATMKIIFSYKRGKLVGYKTIQDKFLANYFFYCCYEIGEIISDLAKKFPDQFLFFWVDGIYFRPDVNAREIMKYLREKGYNSSFKILSDCMFDSRPKYLHFTCKENPTDTEKERKLLNIPLSSDKQKKTMKKMLKEVL